MSKACFDKLEPKLVLVQMHIQSKWCQWQGFWSSWYHYMYPQISPKIPTTIHSLLTPLLTVILGLDFSYNYVIEIDWFLTNQLHLHQGPKSIIVLDPALFPLHVNQISTLPPQRILVRTIAIVPVTFNSTPKPNYYYVFTEMSYQSQQNLFVVLVLKVFDAKLPVCLPCTIINTSPDDIILQKNSMLGEMKLLSNIDDSFNPPAVNEVRHDINSSHIEAHWMQPKSYSFPLCKTHSNS